MIPPNLVKFTANNSGTGAIVPGSAVSGFRGVEALTDGGVYGYSIQQEADWEYGRGTYLAGADAFVRSPFLSSTGGEAINLQANTAVAIVLLAEDLLELLAAPGSVDLQALAREVQRATGAEAFLATRIIAASLGIQSYASLSAMNADTTKPINTFAVVTGNTNTYRYTSGGWVVDMTLGNALTLFVQPLVDSAKAASLTVPFLTGGISVETIGGDPNSLAANVPNAADETPFNLFILQTNTGPVTLTTKATDGTLLTRAVANGGGVDIVAGDFKAGFVYPIQYSAGGGKFIVLDASGTSVRPPPPPNGTNDPDLSDRPWGAVTFSGATRVVTPVQKYLLVAGSSNANADYVPPAQRPDLVLTAALAKYFPADGLVFNPINVSEPGAPFAAIAGQLEDSTDYAAGRVTWAHLLFGMNDARTLFYHSQGGIRAEMRALRDNAKAIRDKGVEPVLYTIFPPDPRASTTALDPFFFSTPGDPPAGGTTSSMDFPATRAAPVDPETQMYPPAGAPTVVQPWTSSGIARTGYKRIWHVNREIRRVAADLGCVLIDLEQSTYRTVIEPLPDLGAGLETYYETGNPLHPRAALYDLAVTPLLDAWALSVAQGRSDREVYA